MFYIFPFFFTFYYSIFHAIRAVLSIEGKDFKKHKTVVAYFNEHYVNTEIFPKKMGKKIKIITEAFLEYNVKSVF